MTDNITIPRATVQQALLALEGWDNYGKWAWPDTALEQSKRNTTESLASLRAALAQQAEPVYRKGCAECGKAKQVQEDDDEWKADLAKGREILARQSAPQQQAEPVALDKIKHCHTKMRLFDFEQHADHEYAGLPHRPYASSYKEGCYLCATLAEIERLQKKLEQHQAEPIGWLDGNDKLAEFMHRDLKAEHDKRGSATPREFTVPVYTAQPQRKPLTDEMVHKAMIALNTQSCGELQPTFEEMKVAIEAALSVKEGT